MRRQEEAASCPVELRQRAALMEQRGPVSLAGLAGDQIGSGVEDRTARLVGSAPALQEAGGWRWSPMDPTRGKRLFLGLL